MHRPVLVTPPDATPVTLAEAKAHLRVDFGDDDTLITSLIAAATEYLDGWTGILGRALASQEWRQDFDRFARCLPLPLGPVSAIVSITWRNSAGQIATVSADNYGLKTDAGGGSYVRFEDAYSLPNDLYESAAVNVTFTAGYPQVGGVSTVPEPIKQAILLMIGHWYEHREEVVVGSTLTTLPLAAMALIAPWRWLRV